MSSKAVTPGGAVGAFSTEQQREFVLARLRSYGPAFEHELAAECFTASPALRVSELVMDGYHIDTLRSYRRLPEGSMGWTVLYVLRVKDARTGEVMPAPVPIGHGPVLERWAS